MTTPDPTTRAIAEKILDEVVADLRATPKPYIADPDEMTGEGILAAILAKPEPPAWYEQQR